ncbi:MAG TPA: hypothetical protein VHE77_17810 [Dongiaceae bacterium]|nr:hypothetical protein [Dongiaceae bacterium]
MRTALAFMLLILLCQLARAEDAALREQRSLSVAGVKETWQLVWESPPKPTCGPDSIDEAITCPCIGTAYGEAGKLALVRMRGGSEVERLELGPLFGQFDGPETPGVATLIRWPMLDGDFERDHKDDPTLQAEIRRRPAPTVMRFADYDHDGAETEFLLPVGTLSCGKVQYAAIGVTAGNPHLHALGSAAHPDALLAMPLPAWHALLLKTEPSTIELQACGDHGSEERSTLTVSVGKDGIHAHERDFSCPADGSAAKLLQESDW